MRGALESNGEEVCYENEMQKFGDFQSEAGMIIIQCFKISTEGICIYNLDFFYHKIFQWSYKPRSQ